MKGALALYVTMIFATGCTTTVYDARYDIDLSGVERREAAGEVKRLTDVHGHTFEDEFIKVTWTPFETQLGLILVNKTDSPQTVLWEEIRYVGVDGKSDRAVHQNAGAAVAPGDTLLELIEPAGHISPAGVRPLIGYTRGTSEAKVRSNMVRGTIKVFVPIAMRGRVREYVFQFSVEGKVVASGWSS